MNAQAHTPSPSKEGIEHAKRQMLTHQQFFKLCEWLRQNRKDLLSEPTTLTILAKIASGETAMNRIISPSSIASALEATGLRMKTQLPNSKLNRPHGVSREDFQRMARIIYCMLTGVGVPEDDVEWVRGQI